MPVLIEVAAVDSGGGRRWHFGASPLACQPSRSTESTPRWLTPCIALHTPDAGPAAATHQTPLLYLVSSAATLHRAKRLQSVCCVWWVAFVTALSPGSRLAYGRLACHRAFAVEFSSCGAQSPEEVSGVPTSQPHIRCTRGVKGVLCNRFRETRAFLGIASPW